MVVILGESLMITSAILSRSVTANTQSIEYARAFLHGKLYIMNQITGSWDDFALFNGRYYWPPGPFPILILMPLVAVADIASIPFNLGYLHTGIVLLTGGVWYAIAMKSGFARHDAICLSIAFHRHCRIVKQLAFFSSHHSTAHLPRTA